MRRMPKRIIVTALQPLHYEGRSHVPGSVFEATPVDAASLTYRRKAKLGGQLAGGTVPEHPSITRRVEPLAEFRSPSPALPTAETPVETVNTPPATSAPEEPPSPRGRRGRTYQRRDMVAEPPTNDSGE